MGKPLVARGRVGSYLFPRIEKGMVLFCRTDKVGPNTPVNEGHGHPGSPTPDSILLS